MNKNYNAPCRFMRCFMSILFFCPCLVSCQSDIQKNQNLTEEEILKLHTQLEEAARTNPPIRIIPGIGMGDIHFGMSVDEIEKQLGEPFQITGKSYHYQHLGFAILINEAGEVNRLVAGGWCEHSHVLCKVFKGVTSEGIKMGSTKENVSAAYGKPEKVRTLSDDDDENSFEVWHYPELGMRFAFHSEKLVHITMSPKSQ